MVIGNVTVLYNPKRTGWVGTGCQFGGLRRSVDCSDTPAAGSQRRTMASREALTSSDSEVASSMKPSNRTVTLAPLSNPPAERPTCMGTPAKGATE